MTREYSFNASPLKSGRGCGKELVLLGRIKIIVRRQEILLLYCNQTRGIAFRNIPPDKGGPRGVVDNKPYIKYNTRLTQAARSNRHNPTRAELKLWNEVLRNKQLKQFKFVRQKPIGNFILDFYCSELLLAIEVDGDSHSGKEDHDEERTRLLGEYGIKVIRYTNDQVLNNIDGVYRDLIDRLD